MAICGVMFDLDGTLLNTLCDLEAAANHALAVVGQPTHEREAYRRFVGRGVQQLFVDALTPEAAHLTDQAVASFLAFYADHHLDTTQPYAGINDLLDTLTAQGIALAILSNKPDPATQKIVAHFFGQREWIWIRGHREGTAPKPDPTAAYEAFNDTSIPADQWAYVGDSDVDMQTGKRAGMLTVGVSWGFRDEKELRQNGADDVIHCPADLIPLVTTTPHSV